MLMENIVSVISDVVDKAVRIMGFLISYRSYKKVVHLNYLF